MGSSRNDQRTIFCFDAFVLRSWLGLWGELWCVSHLFAPVSSHTFELLDCLIFLEVVLAGSELMLVNCPKP